MSYATSQLTYEELVALCSTLCATQADREELDRRREKLLADRMDELRCAEIDRIRAARKAPK